MSELAGMWVRVSSGGQDEANQLPAVQKYCAAHGYPIGTKADGTPALYEVHAKSAWHGKQQADLDQAVADMRAGRIKVLVIWHSSRIERREGKALLDTLAEFTAAGGRVESVQEPELGALDFGGQLMTFVSGLINYEKSRIISEGVKLSHNRITANGGLIGRNPWGMTTAGEKYSRRLVPTPEGRRFVPQIFARAIVGDSQVTISQWLEAEGASPFHGAAHWSPKSVGQILANPAYAGRRVDANGVTVHRCDPIVTEETFAAAGQAVKSRLRRGKRPGRSKTTPALLTSVLRCSRCLGKMYRTGAKPGFAGYYYCTASPDATSGLTSTLRKSTCKNMIKVTEADERARELLARITTPVTRQEWVSGDDSATALAGVQADIASLQAEFNAGGIELAVYVDKLTALDTYRKDLAGREPQPGHYEAVPTGQSYGQMCGGLDDAALRELLVGNAWFYAHSADFPRMTFAVYPPGADRPAHVAEAA